ncbi:lactate utilization protein [Desulfopila sp. IMCC35008]|uniref:lactate utilization protein n=1 Tax=Desulfopila sp. IMCC35008 TaxID=2653858 RepID=UPI00197ABD8D|nr:lactate utilization protein [Desulfopila sp. IMCC35008]
MKEPMAYFGKLRCEEVKENLEKNNFEVYFVEDRTEAATLVLEKLIPQSGAKSVSYGGSTTMKETGLLESLQQVDGIDLLRPDERDISNEEKLERRRQGLLVDLYITGTNAVTEDGWLVNLDMIGNRVGAITFGPKQVIILVGRNKIVEDLDAAMFRIKDYAAPVNAMRLDCKTPCVKTGHCEDCKSPGRICNSWTITEKSFPKGRIKVILINEDMGF